MPRSEALPGEPIDRREVLVPAAAAALVGVVGTGLAGRSALNAVFRAPSALSRLRGPIGALESLGALGVDVVAAAPWTFVGGLAAPRSPSAPPQSLSAGSASVRLA